MGKLPKLRKCVQALSALLQNPPLSGLFTGRLYTGGRRAARRRTPREAILL